MRSALTLRLATPDDAPALAQAWYAMMEESGLLAPDVDPRWRTFLEADFRSGMAVGTHVWFVAEEEGRILGTGAAFFRGGRANLALHGLSATLAGIYTEPVARRRGIARAIVERLVDLCRTRGCRSIRLRATEKGRPLYEQFGFVTGDEMVLKLPD